MDTNKSGFLSFLQCVMEAQSLDSFGNILFHSFSICISLDHSSSNVDEWVTRNIHEYYQYNISIKTPKMTNI